MNQMNPEFQLINSVIQALIIDSRSNESFFYDTLLQVPQTLKVFEILFNSLINIKDVSIKANIMRLISIYVVEKAKSISDIEPPQLFEFFRKIVCESPQSLEFLDYISIGKAIEILISNLTTFSPQTLYSSLMGWSTWITPISLVALSSIQNSFHDLCFSYLVHHFVNSNSIRSSLYVFMIRNTYKCLSNEVFQQSSSSRFIDHITNHLKSVFMHESNDTVSNIQLLTSLFHFLPIETSCAISLDFCNQIQKFLCSKNELIRIAIAESLSYLPASDEDPTFNSSQQLLSFAPYFGFELSDFVGSIASSFSTFIRPRSSHPDFGKWITGIFLKKTQIGGAVYIACHFDLFENNPELISFAFPLEPTLEHSRSICLAACSLGSTWTLKDYVVEPFLGCFFSVSELWNSDLFELIDQALISMPQQIKGFEEKFINSLLIQSRLSLITIKRISILIRGIFSHSQKLPNINTKKDDLILKISSLLIMMVQNSDESESIIDILQILSGSTVLGNVYRDSSKIKLNPLANIIDIIIPTEFHNEIHNNLLSTCDSKIEANVISVCFVTDIPNPESICKRIEEMDPMIPELFIMFFQNAAYRNLSMTLDKIGKIVKTSSIPKNTSSIFRFMFWNSNESKPKVSGSLIFRTLLSIISSCVDFFNEECIKTLLNIFDSIFVDNDDGKMVLSAIISLPVSSKAPISLVEKVIKSKIYISLLPHFLRFVPDHESTLLQCLNGWKYSLSMGYVKVEDNASFSESLFKKSCLSYNTIIEALLKDQSYDDLCGIDLLLKISMFCVGDYEKKSEHISFLLSLCFIKKQTIIESSLCCLAKIFGIDSNISSYCTLNDIIDLSIDFIQNLMKKLDWAFISTILSTLATEKYSFAYSPIIYCVLETVDFSLWKDQKLFIPFLLKFLDYNDSMIVYYTQKSHETISSKNIEYFISNLIEAKNNQMANKIFTKCLQNNFEATLRAYIQEIKKKKKIDNDFLSSCGVSFYEICFYVDQYNNIELLLWLSIIMVCFLTSNYDSLSESNAKLMENKVLDTISQLLLKFKISRPSLPYTIFDNLDTLGNELSYYISLCSLQSLEKLFNIIESPIGIKRNDNSNLIIGIGVFLGNLYKRLRSHNNSTLICEKLCVLMSKCSIIGKDDCSRAIASSYSYLFDISDIIGFNNDSINNLLQCCIRSLINPDDETRIRCVILFTQVLLASPSNIIQSESKKLYDMLSKSFEVSKEVGMDKILESVYSLVKVESTIRPYINMSPLSLPRLFILSVSESIENQIRAKNILKLLTKAVSDEEILENLKNLIGNQEFLVICMFLVDWASKSTLSKDIIILLKQMTHVVSKDENLQPTFFKKITPLIMPIVTNVNNPIQNYAIEILLLILNPLSN